MRRALTVIATLLLIALGTTACGDDDGGGGDSGGSSEPKVIDITFDGDDVTPNGDRIDVGIGQPITLKVTADAPGEIHVHSDPEQEYEYDAGSKTIEMDPIETAGIVEVESHTLDKTIMSLEVR